MSVSFDLSLSYLMATQGIRQKVFILRVFYYGKSFFLFEIYYQLPLIFKLESIELIYLTYMKPNKTYQKSNYPQQKKPQDCKLGWDCPYLLKKSCSQSHDPDDSANAQSLKQLLSRNPNKEMVVILEKKSGKGQFVPLCLFDPYLPIRLIGTSDPPMDVGTYYVCCFVEVQERRAVLEFKSILGLFGDWKAESLIFRQFCLSQYELSDGKQGETFRGFIKVNGANKMLKGDLRRKHQWHLEKVNEFKQYPVLNETKVQYYQKNNKPLLTKITHPKEIRMSGIIQIDKNGQFYFIPRNTTYDDMNLYHFPTDVQKHLEGYNHLFPYSVHKKQPIERKDLEKINSLLNGLLVKGYFKDWLLNSRYPLIELIDDEAVQRTIKNQKNAIIFQAGIDVVKPSKQQVSEAKKLFQKFKLKDYESRPLLHNILTVDSKQTKCHDDALFIKQQSDGGFMVEIHIADVAQLIKVGSQLDRSIKKRDSTIYIKNYYQPMIAEPLRSLLSLKKDEDKLAFTLQFKLTAQGLIDFNTVDFFRSRINVQQNLSHELLSSKPNTFPQLFAFDSLLAQTNLVDSNYILQCESKSEVAMARLIVLSSIIPTFLLEQNIQRSTRLKEQINDYIKKMIEEKSTAMEKWEEEVMKINKVKKEVKKIDAELKSVDNLIKKELKKIRSKITEEVKSQHKALQKMKKVQQKEKKQRVKKSKQEKDYQSEDSVDSQSSVEESAFIEEVSEFDFASKVDMNQQIEEALDDAREQQLKQKRAKIIKDLRQKEISSESESEESVSDEESDLDFEDQQIRMTKAMGGRRYLQNIFSIFKIDMQWKSIKEITQAFNTILSKNKSKIYQEYFKRMQIMNRQHFRYIIRMVEEQRGDTKRQKKGRKVQEAENQHIKRNAKTNKEKVEVEKEQTKMGQPKKQFTMKKQQLLQNRIEERETIKEEQKRQRKSKVQIQKQIKVSQTVQQISNSQPDVKQIPRAEKRVWRGRQPAKKKDFPKNPKQSQGPRRQRRRKEKNVKIQKEEEVNQTSIKFQMTQSQVNLNNLIKEKIKNNQELYYQKYHQQFLETDKLDVSDDDLWQGEQDQRAVSFFRSTKSMFIRILFKKINKNKNIPLQSNNSNKQTRNRGKYNKNDKQSNKVVQKHHPSTVRDQMDLLVEQYMLSRRQKQEKIPKIDASSTKMKDDFKDAKVSNQFSEKEEKVSLNQLQVATKSKPKVQGQVDRDLEISDQAKDYNPVHDEMNMLIQRYFNPDLRVNDKEAIKEETKKLTKKQLTAKIQGLIKPFEQQLKLKYSEQITVLKAKLAQSQDAAREATKLLEEQLNKSAKDYNLIRFIADGQQPKQQAVKGKQKQKQRKVKKAAKKGVYSQFLQNFEAYASKVNFKFLKMNDKELDQFLQKEFKMQKLCTDQNIELVNRAASRTGKVQEQLLKWNNPIRSYQSLQVMRIIKKYDWLFRGNLHPTDVILYSEDLKDIKKELKQLQKYREDKIVKGQTNKKAKEANRQIAKLQFYNLLKKNQTMTFTFLTITSRPSANIREVYHPILQEITIQNLKGRFKNDELFKEVQARVKVKTEFPLEYTAELI